MSCDYYPSELANSSGDMSAEVQGTCGMTTLSYWSRANGYGESAGLMVRIGGGSLILLFTISSFIGLVIDCFYSGA